MEETEHLAKNLAQEKMKTESKHKDVMELRNAGMPYREEELKGKQICLAN